MANASVQYMSYQNLAQYDGLIKTYIAAADSVVDAKSIKTVGFDDKTGILSFYKKETVTSTDVADYTVTIPVGDVSKLKTDLEALTTRVSNVEGTLDTLTGDADTDGSIAKAIKAEQTRAEGVEGALTTAVGTAQSTADAAKTAAETAQGEVDALEGVVGTIPAGATATTVVGYAKEVADAVASDLSDLETLVGTIPSGATATTVVGYAKEVADAAAGDASQVASDLAAYKTTNDAAVKAAQDAADAAQDDVDALEDTVGDMTAVKTTAKTVAGAVDELYDAIDSAESAGVVTLTTAESATEGYLKTYVVSQGGTEVGKIDIPKDLVVKSGEVVVNPAGQPEGTYIKLVIANDEETPIFIDVKNLVDIYKGEESATSVQITVDGYTIKAEVVDGAIATAKLADSAVTTAKIADENVTKAKLDKTVQASLDAADAAAGLAATAEQNAKDYADGLDSAMDTRVDALEAAIGEGGSVASQIKEAIEALDSAASQTAGTDGLTLEIEIEDGKVTNLAGSIVANTYDAYGAASNVLGTAADTADKATVYGAKAYADSLAVNYATAAQGALADTALQPEDIGAIPEADINKLFETAAE